MRLCQQIIPVFGHTFVHTARHKGASEFPALAALSHFFSAVERGEAEEETVGRGGEISRAVGWVLAPQGSVCQSIDFSLIHALN